MPQNALPPTDDVCNDRAEPSERRIKVLFVAGALTGGGAERCVSTICSNLDRSTFIPSVALFKNERSYPLPLGTNVTILGQTPGLGKVRTILRLRALIQREKPDIVVGSHWHPSTILGEALRLCRHRPVFICWVTSNPNTGEEGTRTNHRWLHRTYGMSDALVAVSKGVATSAVEGFPSTQNKLHQISNPIDVASIVSMANDPLTNVAQELRTPWIITAGRMVPAKRHDLLLHAFARLRKRERCSLVILGDGPLRAATERLVGDLDLTESVLMPGFQSIPYAWMRRAALFALSSDWEGQGIVISEAQCLGLPVVSTDCPFGPAEVITHGENGCLVPVENTVALSEAMLRLLREPGCGNAMGAKGRARAAAEFDVSRVVEQVSRLFLSQVSAKRESGESAMF